MALHGEIEEYKGVKVQMSFGLFKDTVSKVLEFEKEWDNDEWNTQYINFKHSVTNYSKKYLSETGTITLLAEWAKEYYQDATPDTHCYWVDKTSI